MTATHLITGGASGIGAALVERLHDRGDILHLLVRTPARAEQVTARWPRVHAHVADLNHPDRLAEELDGRLPERLDSVVHCAGVIVLGDIADQSVEQWKVTLAVNLAAPAELTRLTLPAVREAGGHVVFVNSGAGLRANPAWGSYAASKFGLRALADALRGEEHGNGVRVTTVYPGRTATAMQEETHRQEGKDYDPSKWIAAESIATAVLTALDMPRDAEITDINVRPGR
ncbi:short chain dehydrogenase [Mangrovactinospora gilvigrisea]|uniref:Short chain dehydrogenase n=1 Tax=Mangrovactinospora gilvigrisea TaxID=1428644 RepID=A0A1J7BDJ8_9ACTN|nr:SDR family oxidoreductase [Mangrovactinospora gilvigrisea]OIV36755.1 short chain dehydrogenase [Mangrovactinospora gilvigrisea]